MSEEQGAIMNTTYSDLIKEIIEAIPDAPANYSSLLDGAAIAIAKLQSYSVECVALSAKLALLDWQEPVAAFDSTCNQLFWCDRKRMKYPHGTCPVDAIPKFAEKLYAAAGASLESNPYCWMIEGSSQAFFGEFAEGDAKAEANRIGGTCMAFPVYLMKRKVNS